MLDIRSVACPQDFSALFSALGKGAKPLAGGTDVLPLCRDGRLANVNLVNLGALRGTLSAIERTPDGFEIGAMATMDEIARHEAVQLEFPALAQSARMVGSQQIRNRATLAGNIVNASPAADTVPALVAAGASVVLQSAEGSRACLLENFLLGPGKTVLTDGDGGEIVSKIIVPVPEGGWRGAYHKVGGRTALTISIAAMAMLYHHTAGYRVAYGAVTPSVRRAEQVEQALDLGDVQGLERAATASVSPISDVRASAEYRQQVCVNMTLHAFAQLKEEV